MADVSSLTKSILLNPGTESEHPALDLSKSDFFRYVKERSMRLSTAVLPEVEEISSSLARELTVTPPRIRIRKLAGNACYNSDTHTVSLSESLPLYTVQSQIHHEFSHIGQDKLKAAAVIAHPDKYPEPIVHQSLLDVAQEQKLHQQPLSVSIGELFIQSSETLIRLEDFAYEDGRQHFIDLYRTTYLASFQEIPARIAEKECQLKVAETELQLSATMHEQFRDTKPAYFLGIDRIWNSRRVQTFLAKLCQLKKATLESLAGDISLILPKVELGLQESENNSFS